MRKTADLHTHTPLCGHAAGEPEDFARQAIRVGLTCYGASDHFPLPEGYPEDDSMRREELHPRYRDDWMVRLRNTLEGSGVELLYGTEFDYLPGRMEWTRPAMDAEPFDYRISSIHFLDYFSVDNERNLARWDEVGGADGLWAGYAETMAQMVEEGGFEIIGHMDLPKKFGIYPSDRSRYARAMKDVLHLAAEKGICMELNTAGLRKPVGEIYPAPEIVRLAFEAGVGITLGSDSHAPGEVGKDFDLAIQLAKSAGYRSAWMFRKKQPVELPFD